MYQNWFIDYASYVILERAVPTLVDGLKPVQRRILHAMKEMDDGRFNKVANVIGAAMAYHPHGDAAIGDAIVNLGQKGLLLETQGNWGDIRTGDNAAAPRYIEARLSKFAQEVVFNAKLTDWQLSYDGRKHEPLTLPVKFPLILAQGVEGIAVGLATKIMPHNFNELIDASIDHLRGKSFTLYPDFPTGGLADFSQYNQGKRGGRIRVRARIEEVDKKTLAIRDIPYSTTTSSLIDSILKANDQGKIKIRKVDDNTAEEVEIMVHLPRGVEPDQAIDALYAFTDCEVGISPNACAIIEEKPHFMGVDEMLRASTDRTRMLLGRELEIKLHELREKWHFSSLEKIFIEERIYRDIEECETWEAVLEAIDAGLEPFKDLFFREITQEDIVRLTEIRIKRISKFDSLKADEQIRQMEQDIEQTQHDLENLTDFAIRYFRELKKKYGKGRERKTEIRSFDTIQASQVAMATMKLYADRENGFVGTNMKKAEYVADCSGLDDVLVFMKDASFKVVKVDEKIFVGKDILHVEIWQKGDERRIYNLLYRDGREGPVRGKRFPIPGITREKLYDLGKHEDSEVLYLSSNPNGEAEKVAIYPKGGRRKKPEIFDFASLDVQTRTVRGNIVTKMPVSKVALHESGASTLGGIDWYYDPEVGKLNQEERGRFLGAFQPDDKILALFQEGSYELLQPDLNLRFEPKEVYHLERFSTDIILTAVYFEGKQGQWLVKRFRIETSTLDKRFPFLSDHPKTEMLFATTAPRPVVKLVYGRNRQTAKGVNLDLADVVDVRGWKALGNKVSDEKVREVKLLAQSGAASGKPASQEDAPAKPRQGGLFGDD